MPQTAGQQAQEIAASSGDSEPAQEIAGQLRRYSWPAQEIAGQLGAAELARWPAGSWPAI